MGDEWIRDPEVMFTEIEGNAVLLDPRSRRMFDLNRTGTVVWGSIDDGIEIATSRVVAAFEIDEPAARKDVESLLQKLADAGLLARRP